MGGNRGKGKAGKENAKEKEEESLWVAPPAKGLGKDRRAQLRAEAAAARDAGRAKKAEETLDSPDKRADTGSSRPKGKDAGAATSKGKTSSESKGKGKDKGDEKGKGFDGKGKGKDKDKGKGKGKDEGKGKGKDKGDVDEPRGQGMNVRDLEARISGPTDAPKAKKITVGAVETKGVFCEVRKHTNMGCAVVTMESDAARDAVLELGKRNVNEKGRPQVDIAEVTADLRPHTEGQAGIFVAWGHSKEKQSPLDPAAIAEVFDNLHREIKGLPQAALSAPDATAVSAPQAQAETAQTSQFMPGMPHAAPPQPTPAVLQQQQAAMFAQQQLAFQQAAAAQMMQQQAAARFPMAQQQPQPNIHQMAAALAAAGQALAAALGQGNTPAGAAPAAPVAATATPDATAVSQPQQAATGAAGSSGNAMRAEAPDFTPLGEQQNQWAQLAQAAAQQQQPQQEMTQMWYASGSGDQDASAYAYGTPIPERKVLQIVDPKSGEAINTPSPTKTSALDYLEAKSPQRKAMSIVDPSSGKTVDTLTAVNFKPAEAKEFKIVDPSSGSAVKI